MFIAQAIVAERDEDREAIRTEVMRLLQLHDEESTFLESPVVDATHIEQAAREAQRDGAALNLIGRDVGRYRIERLLGEGGMGLVYQAQQQSPSRAVAVKVIRPAFASPAAVRRFESEANILGRLKHPGIAQIYDAGTASIDGVVVPFFAMELVDGVSIIKHAEKRSLDLPSRLELVIQVARAVQHAHQQGVIHRDLKPGNILVSDEPRATNDASSFVTHRSSLPKILDFGVARLIDSHAALTIESGGSAVIGTIASMSPEQLSGKPDEVDTRSDVYALGVLLFEIVSGELPHDVRGRSIAEAIRIVSETPPRTLAAIDRRWRGDLDTIARAALAPEKERRYQSAGALADDIERFLESRPILARPPSALYTARKFVQRHRTAAAACVAAAVVIAIGGGLYLRQVIETRERATQTAAAQEFLGGILAFINDPAQPGDERLIESLERAALEVDSAFADRPVAEADVRETLGDAFFRLGRMDEAAAHYHESYEIRKRELGPRDQHTWASLAGLGSTRMRQRRFDEAHTILSDVVDARRRLLGEHDRRTLASMNDLAIVRGAIGQKEESEALLRETLALQRTHLGETDRDTLVAALNLANLLRDQRRFEEAEPLYREQVEVFRELYGENNLDTLRAIENLAVFLKRAGRLDEAQPVYERSLAGFRRVLGEDHPGTLTSAYNFGTFLWSAGRRGEAITIFQEAARLAHASLSPGDAVQHAIHIRLADLLMREERYEEAEDSLVSLLKGTQAALGSEHGQTLEIMSDLVALYERWGRPERAEQYRPLIESSTE